MNAKTIRIAAITIIGIVGVIWWTFRRPSNTPDFPNGKWYLCTNKSCGHSFHLTMAQLGDWNKNHYGERPACPDCGTKNALPAVKCDNCGYVFELTQQIRPCPKCKTIPKE